MTIRPKALGRVVLAACFLEASLTYPLSAQQLPADAPIPELRPSWPDQPDTRLFPTVAAPAAKPSNDQKALPATVPVPEKKPGTTNIDDPRLKDDVLATTPPELVKPSNEELVCRDKLRKLGAVFRETTIPRPENGCSLPFPIEVSTLSASAEVAAPVTVNCATALASAKFMREVIQPAAQKTFGMQVKSIAQASGYVCRERNGTKKLSEHAFGNALDIASFTLANDQIVEVKPSPPEKDQRFLTEVRNAACGPFKTVLGPGSNADHALHFHFDLAQRRNGSTYCR